MSDGLQPAAVIDALKRVVDPEFGKDLVALGMAKQVTVADGRVAFTLELPTPAHPLRQRLRDEAEAAVAALPGVSGVDLTVTASFYCAVVRTLATLAIDVEPDYQKYLDKYPFPA